MTDISNTTRKMIKNKLSTVDFINTNQVNELENAIYNYVLNDTIDCRNLIDDLLLLKAKSIIIALIQSDILKNLIINNEINITSLVELSPRELQPEKWVNYTKREDKEINQVQNGDLETETKLYFCPKCKNNDCKYREKQTRSGDEGSTLQIQCKSCSKRWRIYN
jgi:transcription elongation factor S-II